jgi:hypothetical protein
MASTHTMLTLAEIVLGAFATAIVEAEGTM